MDNKYIQAYFINMIGWFSEHIRADYLYKILSEEIHMTDADIREINVEGINDYLEGKGNFNRYAARWYYGDK